MIKAVVESLRIVLTLLWLSAAMTYGLTLTFDLELTYLLYKRVASFSFTSFFFGHIIALAIR